MAIIKVKISEARGVLMAEPVIDPDCRDGKHASCFGGPCGCQCHAADQDAGLR